MPSYRNGLLGGADGSTSSALGRGGPGASQIFTGREELPFCSNDLHLIYEEDVHENLTTVLAMAAGFDDDNARIIGKADQAVDDDQDTSPLTPLDFTARKKFHFVSDEQLQELWREFVAGDKFPLDKDIAIPDSGESVHVEHRIGKLLKYQDSDAPDLALRKRLVRLGIYLHAFQDVYSHVQSGYGWPLGHLFANFFTPGWHELPFSDPANPAHFPDKTWDDPKKADTMAAETYNKLREAAGILERGPEPLMRGSRDRLVPYAQIEPLVQQFNSAHLFYVTKAVRRGRANFPSQLRDDEPATAMEKQAILDEIANRIRTLQGKDGWVAPAKRRSGSA